MPGGAATTCRDRVQRGHAGHRHADRANGLDGREVGAGLRQDQVLGVDHRVALDLGDVAALDVPAAARCSGVICHSRCSSTRGYAGDLADVLEGGAAERALAAGGTSRGRRPLCRRRARTRSATSSSSMPKQSAIRRTPSAEHAGVRSPAAAGTSGSSTGRPKPTLPQVSAEWWHETSTDSMHGTFSMSVTSAEWSDREDLGQAGVHRRCRRRSSRRARTPPRSAPPRCGPTGAAVVRVAVVTGDPVGGRDDVDARPRGLGTYEVHVGPHAVEGEARRAPPP